MRVSFVKLVEQKTQLHSYQIYGPLQMSRQLYNYYRNGKKHFPPAKLAPLQRLTGLSWDEIGNMLQKATNT